LKLLLDTHAFIWWDDGKLPQPVVRRIQRADQVFVSAVSAWEIAIKAGLGKMIARASVADALEDYGFLELPVRAAHADALKSLPPLHRDPFDRMLVAQASSENLAIVSRDAVLTGYKVPIVWD
jgi:PIN domain nuclease of toxin-antitoxin system